MADTDSNDEDLLSMDDLAKDLKRPRGGRRLPWFAAGLVLGVAATILLPRYAGPYLPFGGGGELLTGPVLSEERDGERLLLTLETAQGALIASFSERVSEIALLVEPGDTVTISVGDYDPFIEDPDFEGVRKAHGTQRGVPAGGVGATVPEESEETMEADSLAAPVAADPDTATAGTAGASSGADAPADTSRAR